MNGLGYAVASGAWCCLPFRSLHCRSSFNSSVLAARQVDSEKGGEFECQALISFTSISNAIAASAPSMLTGIVLRSSPDDLRRSEQSAAHWQRDVLVDTRDYLHLWGGQNGGRLPLGYRFARPGHGCAGRRRAGDSRNHNEATRQEQADHARQLKNRIFWPVLVIRWLPLLWRCTFRRAGWFDRALLAEPRFGGVTAMIVGLRLTGAKTRVMWNEAGSSTMRWEQ
jgi:hypothetical protein